jgi:hypothetical protein
MSKISLSGDPSGTGTFTLASPNSSTDRTLDLPDASGVIDRLNRAGNVLQVVQASFSSVTSINSLTYVSTNHTLTITPSSASSKILIAYYFCFGQSRSPTNTQDNMKGFSIFRDGSNIAPHNSCFFRHQNQASGNINFNEQTEEASICFLDSPATTSAVTYDLRAESDSLDVTIVYNRRGGTGGGLTGSAIAIAMEIAA